MTQSQKNVNKVNVWEVLMALQILGVLDVVYYSITIIHLFKQKKKDKN